MTVERIIEIAEDLYWETERYEHNGEQFIEFGQYSPLGEDYSFTVSYKDADDLAKKIQDTYMDYDVDEHATEWIKMRGEYGVPTSVRALVEDAEAIEKMLEELNEEVWREK